VVTVAKLDPAAEVRDLRELIRVVSEALSLPFDAPDYGERMSERARIVRVVVRDVIGGNPADIGWNTDWLRGRLRIEEAEHKDAES
jgi:hypothetical protein